jgi:ubiquinone/menaquinone biosynthesis C-methylase UbiE
MKLDEIYFYDPVELCMRPLPADGYILDIGGGGEGMIGRLMGSCVIAIDRREDELIEAPDGPLKIVMDARHLTFLDSTFSAATAFFSLMYFDAEVDLQQAFTEASRVLKPGGHFHVWDVDMAELPRTDKPFYAVRLTCVVHGVPCETAYGRPWPKGARDSNYYKSVAEGAGLECLSTEMTGCAFHSIFRK